MLKNISLFKRKQKVVTLLLTLLISTTIQAQIDRLLVRQGNKQFRAGNYAEAEVSYRKAVEKNPQNAQALYNLGNALLGQRKDSAAVSQFEQAAKLETNPIRKSQAFHNIGVVCQGQKQFAQAIEAYKESLRNNPADDETRYNLELCKRQQKQQQDQQNQQNKDNKDNKDQKDKKDQQKQDQDKKDQQKQDQQQQQQNKQQMSKENAEQMLNAAIQEEKQTQERMKKAQQQPNRRSLQKNW
jgi:Ca-activated chloride channel family protein